MSRAHFEDIEIGETDEFGSYTVEREGIVEFAERYDPQPIHTDEAAARDSFFGELIASGWYTAAITMRLLVDHSLAESAAIGGLGVDELRWPTPVRPGDTLSVRTEVVDTEARDEETGLVRVAVTTENDAGEVVMSMVSRVLYERRDPLDSTATDNETGETDETSGGSE